MLLVLPPSRGQTPGPDGAAPLDLETLALPGLTSRRRALIAALAGTEHDVSASPATRAADVLTGVLYGAAGLPHLLDRRSAAAARTRESVLIASPLLGVVRPHDVVPASRLTMAGVRATGSLGTFWRTTLSAELDPLASGRLVVDVRSSEFLPLWHPPADAIWVSVRVEQEVEGVRRVVSHHAKHWRGLLVRHLLERRGVEPADVRSLVRAARGLVTSRAVLAVEHSPAVRRGAPDTLTIVCP